MNKDSKLLAEAYDDVTTAPFSNEKEQIIKNFYKNIEQTIQELTDLNISGRMNKKDAHFRATRETQQAFKKFIMNPYLPNEIR